MEHGLVKGEPWYESWSVLTPLQTMPLRTWSMKTQMLPQDLKTWKKLKLSNGLTLFLIVGHVPISSWGRPEADPDCSWEPRVTPRLLHLCLWGTASFWGRLNEQPMDFFWGLQRPISNLRKWLGRPQTVACFCEASKCSGGINMSIRKGGGGSTSNFISIIQFHSWCYDSVAYWAEPQSWAEQPRREWPHGNL